MKLSLSLLGAMLFLAGISGASAEDIRLTIWNTHNGEPNDRGTKTFSVEALKAGTAVWKREGIKMDWKAGKDCKETLTIPSPPEGYDSIRISITEWLMRGGGFSEIEVYDGAKNISKECKVTVSGSYNEQFNAKQLTDGNTSSKMLYVGYWLLPEQSEGYVDIVLPPPAKTAP